MSRTQLLGAALDMKWQDLAFVNDNVQAQPI